MSDVMSRALGDCEIVLREVLDAAKMPTAMGVPVPCSLTGNHGGPLCSIVFNYEDGTSRTIGHEWYVKLQTIVAEWS